MTMIRQGPLTYAAAGPGEPRPHGGSTTPKTADELKAKLKEIGYTDPVISNMVKAWEDEKDEKKKRALLKSLLIPANKARYEEKYKDKSADAPSAVPPPAGAADPTGRPTPDPGGDGKGKGKKVPPTEEALKDFLKKGAKYSDPAIETMMKAYKAAKNDEEGQKLYDKLKDPKQKAANEKEYNPTGTGVASGDTGAAPPGGADAAADVVPKVPKYTKPDDFDKALKKLRYTTPARAAMVKSWEDEKDPTKRAELEKKLLTSDPTKHAANELEYARKADEPSQDGGSKPKLAGMTEDELRDLLKKKGYDDKDAQDEIMDKLRAIPDEKGQKDALRKDYLRSEDTVKRLNERLGNERRARAAGQDPNRAGGDPSGKYTPFSVCIERELTSTQEPR